MLTEAALPGLWAGDVFAIRGRPPARPTPSRTPQEPRRGWSRRPRLRRWRSAATWRRSRRSGAGSMRRAGRSRSPTYRGRSRSRGSSIWREQWDDARLLLDGLTASSRRRAPGELPLALEALAELDWRTGRWSSGMASAAEGAELADQMDHQLGLIRCLAVLARYHAGMGDEGGCRATLARLRRLVESLEDERWVDGLCEGPAACSPSAAATAPSLPATSAAASMPRVRAVFAIPERLRTSPMRSRRSSSRGAERRRAGGRRPCCSAPGRAGRLSPRPLLRGVGRSLTTVPRGNPVCAGAPSYSRRPPRRSSALERYWHSVSGSGAIGAEPRLASLFARRSRCSMRGERLHGAAGRGQSCGRPASASGGCAARRPLS